MTTLHARSVIRLLSQIKKKITRTLKKLTLVHFHVTVIIIALLVIGTQTAFGQTVDPALDSLAVKVNFSNANPVAQTPAEVKIVQGESENQKAERQKKLAVAIVSPAPKVTASVASTRPDYGYLRSLYRQAGDTYGVPWKLIEAVHQVESGKSGSTSRANPSGATGPMQFMPGTWHSYGVDGNGDGNADITNLEDAIYSGARYLAANGADRGQIDQALYRYNHSSSYVNMVKRIAEQIQG